MLTHEIAFLSRITERLLCLHIDFDFFVFCARAFVADAGCFQGSNRCSDEIINLSLSQMDVGTNPIRRRRNKRTQNIMYVFIH